MGAVIDSVAFEDWNVPYIRLEEDDNESHLANVTNSPAAPPRDSIARARICTTAFARIVTMISVTPSVPVLEEVQEARSFDVGHDDVSKEYFPEIVHLADSKIFMRNAY